MLNFGFPALVKWLLDVAVKKLLVVQHMNILKGLT